MTETEKAMVNVDGTGDVALSVNSQVKFKSIPTNHKL